MEGRYLQSAQQVTDKAMSPSGSTPAPEPNCRAQALASVLDLLKRHLLAGKEGHSMQPPEETSAATNLLTRVATLEARIREAGEDAKPIAELEGEVWRIAVEVQEHARRCHLILAKPEFAMGRTHAKPQSLFLSGGDELIRVAEALAARHGLELFSRPGRGDYARARWNQLCSASVAVFDLREAKGSEALAQVCYELGLALALGKPSVVIAPPGQEMPFKVSLQTISLSPGAAVDQLDAAIITALGSVVWGGAEAGLGQGPRDALAWLDRRFGRRLSKGSLGIVRQLAGQNQDDAVAFRRWLNQFLGMLGADAPAVLLPAWPPTYPDPDDKPRCFHAMPFRESWSDPCRELTRKTCADHGWVYSRGDEAEEQRIIPGIWTEIATASAVLVDVTGHHANVALELGLVHALGRPYRVVAQGDPEKAKFVSLEKVQIHPYGQAPAFGGFMEAVEKLLESRQKV